MFHLFFLFDYYIGNYIKISEADSANGQFNSASGQKIAKVILSGSIVIRDSRFVNEFHILKATCKFCTRLSTFVMTFPFFPLLL